MVTCRQWKTSRRRERQGRQARQSGRRTRQGPARRGRTAATYRPPPRDSEHMHICGYAESCRRSATASVFSRRAQRGRLRNERSEPVSEASAASPSPRRAQRGPLRGERSEALSEASAASRKGVASNASEDAGRGARLGFAQPGEGRRAPPAAALEAADGKKASTSPRHLPPTRSKPLRRGTSARGGASRRTSRGAAARGRGSRACGSRGPRCARACTRRPCRSP